MSAPSYKRTKRGRQRANAADLLHQAYLGDLMPVKTSAASCAMPVSSFPYRSGYAGALDALANFWFKRIEFLNADLRTAPEMNLEMSAEAALSSCLKPHGLTNEQACVEGMFEDGFTMGLRVAAVLAQQPFDAEAPLRRLVDELVAVVHERRQDSAESQLTASPRGLGQT